MSDYQKSESQDIILEHAATGKGPVISTPLGNLVKTPGISSTMWNTIVDSLIPVMSVSKYLLEAKPNEILTMNPEVRTYIRQTLAQPVTGDFDVNFFVDDKGFVKIEEIPMLKPFVKQKPPPLPPSVDLQQALQQRLKDLQLQLDGEYYEHEMEVTPEAVKWYNRGKDPYAEVRSTTKSDRGDKTLYGKWYRGWLRAINVTVGSYDEVLQAGHAVYDNLYYTSGEHKGKYYAEVHPIKHTTYSSKNFLEFKKGWDAFIGGDEYGKVTYDGIGVVYDLLTNHLEDMMVGTMSSQANKALFSSGMYGGLTGIQFGRWDQMTGTGSKTYTSPGSIINRADKVMYALNKIMEHSGNKKKYSWAKSGHYSKSHEYHKFTTKVNIPAMNNAIELLENMLNDYDHTLVKKRKSIHNMHEWAPGSVVKVVKKHQQEILEHRKKRKDMKKYIRDKGIDKAINKYGFNEIAFGSLGPNLFD